MNDIYVVVLNWNGRDNTIDCLYSLKKQKNVKINIVIVDNGSSDNSVETILKIFSDIIIIQNNENLGYAGGMNKGIKYAISKNSKYVLILNNDIIADENLIWHLLSNTKNNVYVTSPVIYYSNKPHEIWSVGGRINPLLLEMTKPHGDVVRLPNEPVFKEFLSGCALFIDCFVFEKIGYFDERFFPGYYEDLDFCLRAKKNNLKMQVIPEARIWHKVSQSSGGKESPNIYFLMARNSGYYFKKHMKLWNALFIILFRLGSAIKKSTLLLTNKKFNCFIAYWRGLINGWIGLLKQYEEVYLKFYK
ncbi:MAG: glycosyltransferase family 2 protein [Anaerolineaceae bacterium]|nr:glycosyltransferase family 2 protein [Anaerolineaceae bacterium]